MTSLANNEFLASRYQAPLPGSGSTVPAGAQFMASFDFAYGTWWKLGGLLFLLGLYALVGLFAQPWALKTFRHDIRPGTRRQPLEEPAAAATAAAQAPDHVPSPLPVKPVALAFHDIRYSVPVPKKKGAAAGKTAAVAASTLLLPPATATAPYVSGGANTAPSERRSGGDNNGDVSGAVLANQTAAAANATLPTPAHQTPTTGGSNSRTWSRRQAGPYSDLNISTAASSGAESIHSQQKELLRGISGFARPGTLTALMGASGAG